MRSGATQAAFSTWQPVVARFVTTQAAAITRPMVLMRSLAVTPGTTTRPTGSGALLNTTGSFNTAEGFRALANSTGSNNTALGSNAGINLRTGDHNVYIGAPGLLVESETIRIGHRGVHKTAYIQGINGATVPSGVAVFIAGNGQLGTVRSSARFKNEIKPMDKASEGILALQPVTFR